MVDAQGFLKAEAAEQPLIAEELNEQKELQESEAPVVEASHEAAPVAAPVEQAQVAERPHAAPVAQTVQKEPELLELEEILSNGMTDLFLALPPDRKQAFKDGGEEAARKIQHLIGHGKATARRIFDIIRHWLRGLPMINRFFLEQEAKMKTDEIVDYVERKMGNIT